MEILAGSFPQEARSLLISRRAAEDRGLRRYYTEHPCKYGHVAERYVSNGLCVECQAIRARENWPAKKLLYVKRKRKPRDPARPLTERQLGILQLYADGGIKDSPSMKASIVVRLGAKNFTNAVAIALRRGLID